MITSRRGKVAGRPGPDDRLYYQGKTFQVEWYVTRGGRFPGLEYYRRMETVNQDRLDRLVEFIANEPVGTLLPRTAFRQEDARHQIYAFKAGPERFFCFFFVGRKIVISYAYRKHAARMTGKDRRVLEAAILARSDYLESTKGGSGDAQA